jgi:hypothetical protein
MGGVSSKRGGLSPSEINNKIFIIYKILIILILMAEVKPAETKVAPPAKEPKKKAVKGEEKAE